LGEIAFSPAEKSLSGSLKKLKETIEAEPEKYLVADQFSNAHKPEIHYRQTAPEIWQDANEEIDIFVAGVGSGGTLQDIGKFLEEKKSAIKIVAAEPKNSAALLGREPGLHNIQGIGDGSIPDVLDPQANLKRSWTADVRNSQKQ